MAEGTQTISFRVPGATAKLLENGGVREGLSRNEYARKLVEASLATPPSSELLSELRSLRESISQVQIPSQGVGEAKTEEPKQTDLLREVRRMDAHINELRSALATGVCCLLAQAGGVEPKEAQSWVTEHMFSQSK